MSMKPIFLPGDKKAIAFLIAIIVLAIVAFRLLGDDGTVAAVDIPADSTAVNKPRHYSRYQPKQYIYNEGTREAELFDFDPNTADSTQLLRLGLQPFQVKSIYRYRARGGVYRTASDFAETYKLTQKQFKALEPYIKISDDYRPAAELIEKEAPAPRDTMMYPIKLQENEHISLNSADTTALRKVPGIGRYYAREIDRHRQMLGGFVSTEQLMEIDGMPEEALTYFTVDVANVKKMNLNRLTINQLKRHPYINFYQARAICDYRRLRGPLKSLDDLRLMKEFTDDDLRRLEPYVEF